MYYQTNFGKIILGDALEALEEYVKPASVDLIMTSPPFGLVLQQEPLDKKHEA